MWLLSAAALFASAAPQQRPPEAATVTGVVWDSLRKSGIAEAFVQLVRVSEGQQFAVTTRSGANGVFSFEGIQAGRYALGFDHPRLDSLGLDRVQREVLVGRESEVRADLAVPSAARMRALLCKRDKEPFGLVIGTVRDARTGAGVPRANVNLQWVDLALVQGQLVSRVTGSAHAASAAGSFSVCGLPHEGHFEIWARHGEATTDRVELRVPPDGFLERDIFVAPPGIPSEMRPSGMVIAADGKPIRNAEVRLSATHVSRSDSMGQWTLGGAPGGTRWLEVRALRYRPERMAVDVRTGMSPVVVTMMSNQALLDTVRVLAARLGPLASSGFDDRRRKGIGRFITADEIMRRSPIEASDALRFIPGLTMERGQGLTLGLRMRSPFGECAPSLYLNGGLVPTPPSGLTAEDIDAWLRPQQIAGIEIYFDHVPPQFNPPGLSGCGSIVVWTK